MYTVTKKNIIFSVLKVTDLTKINYSPVSLDCVVGKRKATSTMSICERAVRVITMYVSSCLINPVLCVPCCVTASTKFVSSTDLKKRVGLRGSQGVTIQKKTRDDHYSDASPDQRGANTRKPALSVL